MTERLYWTDPYLRAFEARLTRTLETDAGPAVVLDRTAFHPEGGGQPCDRGTLNGVEVVDVREQEGVILHVLRGPVQGPVVRGEIDWERRRDHMQQHHGQHLLSRAFEIEAEARTVSFHLGAEICTIDLERAVGVREMERARETANRIVFEDRPVRTRFEGGMRRVEVEGFDVQSCCGTHPHRTGQVGVIAVLDAEKHRGGSRVRFVCGLRAARLLAWAWGRLRALGAALSVPAESLEESVRARLAELQSLRREKAARERERVRAEAAELAERSEEIGGRQVCLIERAGAELVVWRVLVRRVASQRPVVAVAASAGPKGTVFAASASVDMDLRDTVRWVLRTAGGKGGGEKGFVQGRLEVPSAREALEWFRRALSGG